MISLMSLRLFVLLFSTWSLVMVVLTTVETDWDVDVPSFLSALIVVIYLFFWINMLRFVFKLSFAPRWLRGDVENQDLVIGELTAHRAWKVSYHHRNEQFRLQSVVLGSTWTPHEPMDGDPRHGSFTGQGCGVYAYRDRVTMLLQQYSFFGTTVYGKVELWGHVAVHEHGYRAEYANVIELTDISPPWKRGLLNELRRTYGVDAG